MSGFMRRMVTIWWKRHTLVLVVFYCISFCLMHNLTVRTYCLGSDFFSAPFYFPPFSVSYTIHHSVLSHYLRYGRLCGETTISVGVRGWSCAHLPPKNSQLSPASDHMVPWWAQNSPQQPHVSMHNSQDTLSQINFNALCIITLCQESLSQYCLTPFACWCSCGRLLWADITAPHCSIDKNGYNKNPCWLWSGWDWRLERADSRGAN